MILSLTILKISFFNQRSQHGKRGRKKGESSTSIEVRSTRRFTSKMIPWKMEWAVKFLSGRTMDNRFKYTFSTCLFDEMKIQ